MTFSLGEDGGDEGGMRLGEVGMTQVVGGGGDGRDGGGEGGRERRGNWKERLADAKLRTKWRWQQTRPEKNYCHSRGGG